MLTQIIAVNFQYKDTLFISGPTQSKIQAADHRRLRPSSVLSETGNQKGAGIIRTRCDV